MLRRCALWASLLLFLTAPLLALAYEDAEGCKDSPLLTRLGGSIANCGKSDFDAAELIIATSGNVRTRHVEGKVEKIRYECQGKTGLQVSRNTEQALKTAGYTIDFTGYDLPDHYVTAHKGPQWIAVTASEMGSNSAYQIVAVLAGDMNQEMASDAAAWANEINRSGHVAVYGIEFDTGKATLKPESEKVLAQVLTLMNHQPEWKMKIEGHTDSTGTKAGNQTLSQQRAAAVAEWLTKNGIARPRLVAAGLGDTEPIADNTTIEGRARNRRVELVKQ